VAGETGGVGIGTRLRAAREKRGLTVLQAAERLHVDARVLECLEAENFGALGADVYVRGHLRRYAELVGEAREQLQELYASAAPASARQPDLTRIPRGGRGAEASPFMLPAVLAVSGLALAGALWWLLAQPRTRPRFVAQPVPTTATPETPPRALPATAAANRQASAVVQLALRFSQASWAQVSDSGGQVLLDGLVAAGSVRTVRGVPPLRVVLGNATGVTLEIDGRALTLAGMVRRRGDAHVMVSAAGQVSPAAAAPGA